MKKAAEVAGPIRPRVLVSCYCDDDWWRDSSRLVASESPQTEVRFLKPPGVFPVPRDGTA